MTDFKNLIGYTSNACGPENYMTMEATKRIRVVYTDYGNGRFEIHAVDKWEKPKWWQLLSAEVKHVVCSGHERSMLCTDKELLRSVVNLIRLYGEIPNMGR